MLKKTSFGRNKMYKKMPSFLFRELHLITSSLICVSWSCPKTDLVTTFLNLKVEVLRMSVFSVVTFK